MALTGTGTTHNRKTQFYISNIHIIYYTRLNQDGNYRGAPQPAPVLPKYF